MTKTIICCDVCGREITVDEGIYLKRKAGKHGGEQNCDMCKPCWKRICEEAKIGVPSYEKVLADSIRKALNDYSNLPDGTKTADADREFHRTVNNLFCEYADCKISDKENAIDRKLNKDIKDKGKE